MGQSRQPLHAVGGAHGALPLERQSSRNMVPDDPLRWPFANQAQPGFRPAVELPGCASQQSQRSQNATNGLLTTSVWPKSRMLFAVVSKMSKEGVLTQN